MSKEHFMIGDYVKDKTETVEVIEVLQNNFVRVKRLNLQPDESDEYTFAMHQPIPLTPEQLVRLGFVTQRDNYYLNIENSNLYLSLIHSTDGFYPVIVMQPEMSSENEQYVHLFKLDYVHELQHFCHINFKTELKYEQDNKIQ